MTYFTYTPTTDNDIQLLMSNGNRKIGKDTLIFNITSATGCPSRALGLCQIPDGKCYALKAERLYPGCLPYRRRQAYYFENRDAAAIGIDIFTLIQRHPVLERVKYIRFSESGDFSSQADLVKLDVAAEVCNDLLKRNGRAPLIWYGYSARSDLDFSEVEHLLVKGSGHRKGNNGATFSVQLTQTQKQRKTLRIQGFRKSAFVCPGDCSGCNFCKQRTDRPLVIPMH